MKTVKFYTLGCKVNQYDTQSIREQFAKVGFKEILNNKSADTYLINTCTVTAAADSKSRAAIRRCIRQNPRAKVIVTGCLVQNDAQSLKSIGGISLIISKSFFKEGISDFSGRTRAFLKIQDGCNNFCSYCKVPLVRGISRSRSLCEIENEAAILARKDFHEIVLTGICLGSFGKDLKPKTDIVRLLKRLKQIDGLWRIRLSSIEATDVSDELIGLMATSPKICRHLHIPIQSGDDEILGRMNRRYKRKDYLALIEKIKKNIPEIAISTDMMVGFPGEKEKHFLNSMRLVDEIKPLKVHIFPYSVRPGTLAAKSNECASIEEVRQRLTRLNRVAYDASICYQNKFINKKMELLVEGHPNGRTDLWEGFTDNYLKVIFRNAKAKQNQLVKVIIKKKALSLTNHPSICYTS